jgi:hypothetical protein
MRNILLFSSLIAILPTLVSAQSLSDTLYFDFDRMDSLMVENPGNRPERLDMLQVSVLKGAVKTFYLEFYLGDTLYLKSFGSADPDHDTAWTRAHSYASFKGVTVPAHGRLVFRGRVVNIPTMCPCEDALAIPAPHAFRLELEGPGLRIKTFLTGDVSVRQLVGVRIPPGQWRNTLGGPRYGADGRKVGEAANTPEFVLDYR